MAHRARTLLLIGCLLAAACSSSWAAFGVTTSTTYYTVDTGAGLVFQVLRANGSIDSFKLNGTELNDPAKTSSLASGLGSTGTTVSMLADANHVVVTVSTDATNTVAAGLTHYYIVQNGVNNLYMATYAANEPTVGELRWITRLQNAQVPNAPVESNLNGNTGAVESSDVFGLADGTTRSKYYGNQHAMDLSIRGVTGTGVGVFMVYGNRESSDGGPFYHDIQNQTGTDSEVYNYMNSGHNQTDTSLRLGVLNGPYALFFTTGATPALPDMSFAATLGLTGYVDGTGRGGIALDAVTGRDTNYPYTVGFANAAAQYWTTAALVNGAARCDAMKPGAYTMTIYKGELEIYSAPVTVTVGTTTDLGTIALTGDPARTVPVWRVGNWDGTPLEFHNGPNIALMHPSDVRQASWTPGTFVVGSNTAADFPSCQWVGVNNGLAVQFNLTSAQVAACNVRIGITAAYAGGRPRITVNSWTPSANPSPSSQPDSRSLTVGTYRGNNAAYVTSVPASALVVGTNTLYISSISGSSGTGFLSPGYAFDCVEMSPQNATVLDVPGTPPGTTAQGTANPRTITLSWNTTPGAASYEIRRATSASGVYSVVASGPALTWTDQDVAAPGVYSYLLSAVNGSGKGAPATFSIDPAGPPRVAAVLTWTGALSSNWDLGTSNWSYPGGGTYFYYPDDSVVFDDTSSVLNVNLTSSLSPAAVTVDSANNYLFSGPGTIAGPATLTKSGAGSLTISTAQTFSGGTTINAGTLVLGSAAALGPGNITLAGGTLATGALAPANSIVVAADSRITGGNSGGSQGIRAVAGTGTLTLEATSVFDLEGSLANFSGTLAFTGTGSFRLFGGAGSAAADFNLGTRSLNARSGSAYALGSLSGLAGSTLGNNGSNSAPTVTFTVGGNGRDTTFAGLISNGSSSRLTALAKTGSGTLTLTGANTYTGATTVAAGTLRVAGSLGSGSAVSVGNGGTLDLSGTGAVGNVQIQAGGALTGGGRVNGTFGNLGTVVVNSGTLTLAGASATNSGTIRLTGAGTLSINGTLVNNGVLDLINSTSATTPANLQNNGVILRASDVRVLAASRSGGLMTLSVHCFPGHTYKLQTTPTLINPVWADVPGASLTPASEVVSDFTDPNASGAQSFYRVVTSS